jgi:two-component system nitrogen regulation sensor histidine kinase NtrY
VLAICLACVVPIAVITMRAQIQPILSLFRALEGTVTSYKDGDFSFSLHWPQNDELADLVAAHNALGNVLREQRLELVQRELLLDTMVQNTPVAMLLVAEARAATPIVYANLAARQLLNQGRKLEGHRLREILRTASPALVDALARGGDGLFTAGDSEDEEVYHLARRSFSLNGRKHELLLLRQLTLELRRQEVQTWKKVIRVISHELNNSLAPLTSLAHSGAELVRRGQTERLPQSSKRSKSARAIWRPSSSATRASPSCRRRASKPAPGTPFVAQLASQAAFRVLAPSCRPRRLVRPGPDGAGAAQPAQERARIGLAPEAVELRVKPALGMLRIEVSDRGPGMNDAVLTNALVPFYSTKRSGTGLGLALAREIAEAHGGRITLGNRDGGGLAVTMIIPAGPPG